MGILSGIKQLGASLFQPADELSQTVAAAKAGFDARFKQTRARREQPHIALADELIDATQKYYFSRGMAVSYAVGGSGSVTAPQLFETYLTRDHFPGGTEHERTQGHITRLISQFQHGREIPVAAAELLYARLNKVVGRDAPTALRAYLGDVQNGAAAPVAMARALGPQAETREGRSLAAWYALAEETRAVLKISEGPEQHIAWLLNARKALDGDGNGLVGRKIGVVAGALQASPAAPTRLRADAAVGSQARPAGV